MDGPAVTPWFITYFILGAYACNIAWLAWFGNYWGSFYWACALGITISAMQAVLK